MKVSDISGKEEPPPDPGAEDTSDLIGHQDANYLERTLRPHLSRPPDSPEQQNNNGQRSQILAPKPHTGQMLQGTASQNPHNFDQQNDHCQRDQNLVPMPAQNQQALVLKPSQAQTVTDDRSSQILVPMPTRKQIQPSTLS